MYVYHVVNPDLRVQKFFEKDGAAENRDVDFEIGDLRQAKTIQNKTQTDPTRHRMSKTDPK